MKTLIQCLMLTGALSMAHATETGTPCQQAYAAKQYPQALTLCQQDSSKAEHQHLLGQMHYFGHGTKEDDAQALKWYLQAARQNHAPAQNMLGQMHRNGHGVPQNYTEAMRWYRQAAEQGDSYAQNNIGYLYQEGLGVPQNYTETMRWYRQAAEQGNSSAQSNIGFMYHHGHGTQPNYAEAMRWYRQAAEQGNSSAQNNIGALYRDGLGVDVNYAEAAYRFALAIENDKNNKIAKDNLSAIYPKLRQAKVKAQATLYATADNQSRQLGQLNKQQTVYVLDNQRSDWHLVLNRQNHGLGWVRAERLQSANPPAAPKPRTTHSTSSSTSHSINSCTNHCVNGDCLRTYPNGKKVRYQAPFVFNPITGKFEFDVSGC